MKSYYHSQLKPSGTDFRKNFGGVKQADDYWMWKAVFAAEMKANTKTYNNYKRQGNGYIDTFSLTADVPMFQKLNQGAITIIKNEIGQPKLHFNTIVGIESGGFIQGPILA